MAKSDIHRDFHLTSPLTKGPDVKELQKQLNAIAKNFPNLTRYHLKQDGEFGLHTLNATHRAAFLEGLTDSRLEEIAKRDVVAQEVQGNLRRPGQRSKAQKDRAKKRREEVRKRNERRDSGAGAAVSFAHSKLGTTESPSGSNLGENITEWERYTDYSPPPGVFWCGCFVCYAVVHEGKARIPVRSRLGYSVNIDTDARNHANGLSLVSPTDARPGDIVTFRFEGSDSDHIGLCVGPTKGGLVHTIDGNTSSDAAGSQSNGGGVFEKKRSAASVVTVARPDYA
jgi:cell wall-associated NlpC family hydrolase